MVGSLYDCGLAMPDQLGSHVYSQEAANPLARPRCVRAGPGGEFSIERRLSASQ